MTATGRGLRCAAAAPRRRRRAGCAWRGKRGRRGRCAAPTAPVPIATRHTAARDNARRCGGARRASCACPARSRARRCARRRRTARRRSASRPGPAAPPDRCPRRHEVAGVEAADQVERGTAHQQARARQPAGRPLDRVTALPAIGRGPGIARPPPTAQRMPDAAAERRQLARRRVDHPLRGVDQRAEARSAWPARRRSQQLVERAWFPCHVRVGDHHELRVGGSHPGVGRAAVADVAATRQHPNARPMRRLADRGIGPAALGVVGEHDVKWAGSGVLQRIQKGRQGRAGGVGDHDDRELLRRAHGSDRHPRSPSLAARS